MVARGRSMNAPTNIKQKALPKQSFLYIEIYLTLGELRSNSRCAASVCSHRTIRRTDYLLELSAYCLMPCISCKIVYIVRYSIGYRGISLSIVHIVLYSVASNLRQMHNHFRVIPLIYLKQLRIVSCIVLAQKAEAV